MRHTLLLPATCLLASGCSGIQSSLAPASREAERIAALWWSMAIGAVVIWIGVLLLAVYFGREHDAAPSRRRDRWLILGAGVAFPIVVLTGLLAYGLSMIPPLVARAPEGSLLVDIEGELWWWRVRYQRPDGSTVELANEIRLPVGESVQFRVSSDNVIHAFWIPALGGKIDAVPGRTNYLAVHPTRVGVFAGACAEYCGTAHAFMRLFVQVMDRAAFDAWLAHQATAAAAPTTDAEARGRELVLANGCGACHTVRGTTARGVIAPDLTHVAGRMSLAAGTLRTGAGTFESWLASPAHHKPGVRMPAYGMLDEGDRRAIATYLGALQ
jgi:cytochrome c oxidase subunit 2